MKRAFDTLTIVLIVLFVALTLSSQNANSQIIHKKYCERGKNIRTAIHSAIPVPAGTYTVGKGGYFSTLGDAFDSLSINGISGTITLSLIDTLYDATTNFLGSFYLGGPISGTSPNSRITIRPAENVAVTIKGNGEAVLLFENVSYLTIDGVSLTGNTRMKVQALYNTLYICNDGIDFNGNCDFNILQSLTVCTDDISRVSNAIGLFSAGGAPDSCLVSGVGITSGTIGIYVEGTSSSRPTGNVLRNNHIGSPRDSLIAWGIQDASTTGSIIENNHVENLRCTTVNFQFGINTYKSRNTIIRNNMVHNLNQTGSASYVIGIHQSGDESVNGINNWVYNNRVWDLKAKDASTIFVGGIVAWKQDTVRIEYNTVYLAESGDANPTYGSNALHISTNSVFPIVRNNVLVNTRDDNPGRSTAITVVAAEFLSDYNDLYVGFTRKAYIGNRNDSYYETFADWKTTGKDINSVSVCPKFCSSNLHIDTTDVTTNSLDGKGTPIEGILTDFEGQLRNTFTPDIGADEFDITLGITKDIRGAPETFALSQNYPNPFNPTTMISYQLPVNSYAMLIVYDLLGREMVTLVNEKKDAGRYSVQWDAQRYSSGIYFYRLQAGNFVEVKKMVLLK